MWPHALSTPHSPMFAVHWLRLHRLENVGAAQQQLPLDARARIAAGIWSAPSRGTARVRGGATAH